ncbi:hypothetical protein MAR_014516 [Mya arenaria]|uniref:Uncharacterized protein n=1 Tax=Mya arenaria TaxID=6604 RepID=A0ABY7G675_MYAAR|nr:hypothetical protein MAR_014516 [Mya arenaria]
MLMSAPVLK